MCRSMVDIQSAAAEIRRGKKKDRKKPQGKNLMVCPIPCSKLFTPFFGRIAALAIDAAYYYTDGLAWSVGLSHRVLCQCI